MKRFIAKNKYYDDEEFILYADYVTISHTWSQVHFWQRSKHWWQRDVKVGVVSSSYYDVYCADADETAGEFAKSLGVQI